MHHVHYSVQRRGGLIHEPVFPARLKHTSRSCAGWTNPRCPLSGKVMFRDVVRDVVHDVVVAVDGDVCLVYQLVYGSNFVVP
jgi:hypothetical protein